jgi:hypothetical protein
MVYQFVNAGSGNDSNNGTSEGTAVATLNQAMVNIIAASENGSHLIITDSSTYTVTNALGGVPSYTGDRLHIMAKTGSDGMPEVSPVLDGGNSNGTGGSPVAGAIRATYGWVIRGLTFQNYIISSVSNGAIYARSISSQPITIENCTFRHITGSAIDLSEGTSDPGLHIISQNKFHDINTGGSGSAIVSLGITSNKKGKITNNLFYDWQPFGTNDYIIVANGTRSSETIISHNTFGTSSVEANSGDIYRTDVSVRSTYSKFEYNIIYDQTNRSVSNSSFAKIDNGEANYNVYYGLSGGDSDYAPFGGSAAPTASNNNVEADPLFKGTPNSALVGPDAVTNSYKLRGTKSPAFDAAIGSADVTEDITGGNRIVLDRSALDTGIYDIGCYELTGLYSTETVGDLQEYSGDFTINRIPKADDQNKRALQDENSDTIGHDVDQVPLTTAINGALPAFIRKRPTSNVVSSGKKTKG